MADNYLERQRELYEARKAAWEKARRRTGKPKASVHKPASLPSSSSPSPSSETEKEKYGEHHSPHL